MTLKLYHFDLWPNSIAAKVALLERGAQFDTITVDLATGGHNDPAFRAISPAGEPPGLVDTVGPNGTHELAMFEALGVMTYLDAVAAQLQLTGPDFIPSPPCNIPLTFEWVTFARGNLTLAMETILLHGKILPPARRDRELRRRGVRRFKECLDILEARIGGAGFFLNGDTNHPGAEKGTYSAADVVVASALTFARLFPAGEDAFAQRPNVSGYLSFIEARPAFQTALAGITLPPQQDPIDLQ